MPPPELAGFALYSDGGLGKDRRGMKERAVVLAAVEAMADPDAVGAASRHEPNAAAKASAVELVHTTFLRIATAFRYILPTCISREQHLPLWVDRGPGGAQDEVSPLSCRIYVLKLP